MLTGPPCNQILCQAGECIPQVVYDMRANIQRAGSVKLYFAGVLIDALEVMAARGKYRSSQMRPLLKYPGKTKNKGAWCEQC